MRQLRDDLLYVLLEYPSASQHFFQFNMPLHAVTRRCMLLHMSKMHYHYVNAS